jgi:uncharacterized protein with HEPN domain
MTGGKLPAVRLQHMLDEIDGILDFTKDLSAAAVLGSYGHRRAVERAIQIISEAAKELPDDLKARAPDVPWKRIIGIGNLLRHEYCRIDPDVLASIPGTELHRLRPALFRSLQDLR